MNITPNKRIAKQLSLKKPSTKDNGKNDEMLGAPQINTTNASSTPIQIKMPPEIDDDSPGYFPCTQEGVEVDVVWDWNSPQAKQRQKRKQKRLVMTQNSPKVLKRHPSNNQIQNFEKLREELIALREGLAVPDNEDCLILSPLEEAEFKDISNNPNNKSVITPLIQENHSQFGEDDFDELFNDSADEQLLLFSQKIESNLQEPSEKRKLFIDIPITSEFNAASGIRTVNNNFKPETKENKDFNIGDDSFDMVLGSINDDIAPTQVIDKSQTNLSNELISNKSTTITRSKSEVQYNNIGIQRTGKVEFHRTQSFEIANIKQTESLLPKYKLEEIERKRKEALARLESKKHRDSNESDISPTKCSAEEIERKRLQALAKLEAKRQQEIIERKRQEALKRLELSRMKNATMVKSSLTKRL